MTRVVRVRFENGVLRPLEKLDLHEGEVLEIIIKRGFRGFDDKFRGIVAEAEEDFLEEFIKKRR